MQNSEKMTTSSISNQKISLISIKDLVPSLQQPRTHFDEQKIIELAQSIIEHGLLQPLIVKKHEAGWYEIIAGERRFRAAKLARMKRIPCIVANLLEERILAVALIENIQRQDLNPIEEAKAYLKLKESLKLNQEGLAQIVGKDRVSVANILRLLKLPTVVQNMVMAGGLSMGHARALLALENADITLLVAKKVEREGLSVRKLEGLIRAIKSGYQRPENIVSFKDSKKLSPTEKEIRSKLEYMLGTKIDLRRQNEGFVLTMHFHNVEDLNSLLESLGIDL